jgi:hypothetical protein
VLFRESSDGRFRIDLKVIGAYVLVVILHGLWDAVPAALSSVTAPGIDVFIGQVLVGVLGLAILWGRWREGVRLQVAQAAAAAVASLPPAETARAMEGRAQPPDDGHRVLAKEDASGQQVQAAFADRPTDGPGDEDSC